MSRRLALSTVFGASPLLHDLEDYVECKTQMEFACQLSSNLKLRDFMVNILIKFIRILGKAISLELHNPSIEVIASAITQLMMETSQTKDNQRFVLKPGFTQDINDYIRFVLGNTRPERNRDALSQYSLNEIMGAIYGAVVHNGVFHLIFSQCNNVSFKSSHGDRLSLELDTLIATLRSLFGLPQSFDSEKFFEFVGRTDTCCMVPAGKCHKIEKGGWYSILLDMMVYRDGKSRLSIVKRNLNNLEYVRKRTPKCTNADYKASKLNTGHCPQFAKLNLGTQVMLVHGDTWYTPDAKNFYSQVMKSYNRHVKAGPSGSTYMWMNFAFNLIGIEKTRDNYMKLLLCIICDFVPYFHSLSEVLFVFSREYTDVPIYNIDQNPAEWLLTIFGISLDALKSLSDLAPMILANATKGGRRPRASTASHAVR